MYLFHFASVSVQQLLGRVLDARFKLVFSLFSLAFSQFSAPVYQEPAAHAHAQINPVTLILSP